MRNPALQLKTAHVSENFVVINNEKLPDNATKTATGV
jgi:hypothetical protein